MAKESAVSAERRMAEEQMRTILKEAGKYTAVFEPLITQAVQLSALMRKSYEEIMEDGLTMVEIGREGDRKKIHPLLAKYSEISKEYRGVLSEMGLTYETNVTESKKDGLNSLLAEVRNVETR
jgi:hypothetical protein